MSKLWRGHIIQNDIKRSRLSSKTRSRSQRHNSLTSDDRRTHNFQETPYGSAPARIPSPLADALEHSGLPEVCYGSVNSVGDSIEVQRHLPPPGGNVKMPSVLVKSASYGERSRSSSSCTVSSGKYCSVSRGNIWTQTACVHVVAILDNVFMRAFKGLFQVLPRPFCLSWLSRGISGAFPDHFGTFLFSRLADVKKEPY